MTASTLPSASSSPSTPSTFGARLGRGLRRRALGFAAALATPAIISVLIVRYAFPSRLAGAGGGATGFLASLADRHPLFLGLVIFLAISEAGRYWVKRLRHEAAPPFVAGDFTLRSAGRILAALAVVVVLAFVVRSSFVATFRIIGPSMLPTLEIGDRVLVNKLAYGLTVPFSSARLRAKAPQRGDLVVFRAHGLAGTEGAQSVVKRVVGVPGDRLSFEDGDLHINGWLVPYCDAGPYIKMDGHLIVRGRLTVEYLGDNTYLTVRNAREPRYADYTVKSGEAYVVGDDRGVSSDSRLWSDRRGTGVPIDILEGRVSRVLFGARPDGRLDLSRFLAPPLDLKVRAPGFDTSKTDERIGNCLNRRPAVTSPPAAGQM